ncbi:unnamed protein product [Mesocestoides corti]|uniref:Uncharacterized protein n=2 Tax=Mesocestoides corti TaxID=53468 RepID=A0A158QVI1_MESCO|nr:unnamed protein product [Mesocestoides corti]
MKCFSPNPVQFKAVERHIVTSSRNENGETPVENEHTEDAVSLQPPIKPKRQTLPPYQYKSFQHSAPVPRLSQPLASVVLAEDMPSTHDAVSRSVLNKPARTSIPAAEASSPPSKPSIPTDDEAAGENSTKPSEDFTSPNSATQSPTTSAEKKGETEEHSVISTTQTAGSSVVPKEQLRSIHSHRAAVSSQRKRFLRTPQKSRMIGERPKVTALVQAYEKISNHGNNHPADTMATPSSSAHVIATDGNSVQRVDYDSTQSASQQSTMASPTTATEDNPDTSLLRTVDRKYKVSQGNEEASDQAPHSQESTSASGRLLPPFIFVGVALIPTLLYFKFSLLDENVDWLDVVTEIWTKAAYGLLIP